MAGFHSGKVYLALPHSDTPWIVENLIQEGGLTNIYGKPKAGKSFVCLGLAHAITTGATEWMGFPVHKHGPVAFLQIDTNRGEWSKRMRQMDARGWVVNEDWHTADKDSIPFYPFNILDPVHLAWLKQHMALIKPVVVFIDTLREVHSSDENDSTAMRNVVANLVSACGTAAIVMLSHARKDGAAAQAGIEDLMGDNRGSSYIAGRMDVIIRMLGDGKHATGMVFQGRAVENTRIKVTQDHEGFICEDEASATYKRTLQQTVERMRLENPKVSQRKMSAEVMRLTHDFKQEAMTRRDISAFLKTRGQVETEADDEDVPIAA